jgi:hypothetical protein
MPRGLIYPGLGLRAERRSENVPLGKLPSVEWDAKCCSPGLAASIASWRNACKVEVAGVGEGSWRLELRGEGLEGGVGELELDMMEGYARSSDANVVEQSNGRVKRGYFLNQEVS